MLGGTKNIIWKLIHLFVMMICIILFLTHKNQQKKKLLRSFKIPCSSIKSSKNPKIFKHMVMFK